MKFSNIHPASDSDFLSGIFSGVIYCYANFVCYANFLLLSNNFLGGGANCLKEKTAVTGTMYQNTEMSCFQRKPWPNKFWYCMSLNMLKTSKLGLISWTKDKYVKTNGRVPNSTVNRHPGSE